MILGQLAVPSEIFGPQIFNFCQFRSKTHEKSPKSFLLTTAVVHTKHCPVVGCGVTTITTLHYWNFMFHYMGLLQLFQKFVKFWWNYGVSFKLLGIFCSKTHRWFLICHHLVKRFEKLKFHEISTLRKVAQHFCHTLSTPSRQVYKVASARR